MTGVSWDAITADLPPAVEVSADQVRLANQGSGLTYVVLDDDPTGTQSVADLPVLTAWEQADFDWAFGTDASAIYVMTNSRSLGATEAAEINRDVVLAAISAAKAAGVEVAFISRSDSTLRGHFPLETDTIADCVHEATGSQIDGVVIVPGFADAGRITVHGVHYAGSRRDGFVPVGDSEFAKDATFGYQSSRLADWVAEKSGGAWPADQVIEVDAHMLRADNDATVEALLGARNRQPIVFDSLSEDDLRLISLALIAAEQRGSRFIYRVAPPFPRARIGQGVHAPLTAEEIEASRQSAGDFDQRPRTVGGLVVIGSHVDLTTRQLAALREQDAPLELQIEAELVIDPDARDGHLAAVIEKAVEALESENVVITTSRKVITGSDGEESLAIARQVSAAVVDVVRQIIVQVVPRFIIAKGGITSSDVAAKGLDIRRAMVVGPMQPGIISVWSAQDGPAAGVPYTVFAGNVGDENSLAEVVRAFSSGPTS